ncbi:MAG: anthranilate synthase component I family protein [Methanobacteriota archaeon]
MKTSRTVTLHGIEKLADELDRPCLLPVVSTIDGCVNPARLYFSLRQSSRPSYLLESAEGPGELARYSVIGCNPLIYTDVRCGEYKICGRQDLVQIAEKSSIKSRGEEDAIEILKEVMLLKKICVPAVSSRYVLGAVGYISYDYVRSLVDVGTHAVDDLAQPELEFMLPEMMVVFDHVARRTHYCSLMPLLDGVDVREEYGRAKSNLKELVSIGEARPRAEPKSKISMSSNLTKSEFKSKVKTAKQYIRKGDIIQAVLSRRIELNPSPPLDYFYTNLRRINPSPYMFFLDFPERSIVGSSPEILVKVEGRNVFTRPIAGTRRRGRDKADDEAMERELLADAKERAEHLMLVDLGRNDIGRVSNFGSVKISDFMSVEKYSHVQHLVTNVRGEIKKGKDAFDALRATFPAGTVTGAPKVRAMEIIDELEPTRRGIYAGAIGSFSYLGDADLAITIRTLVAERGKAHVQVGAGIVSDSVPTLEHRETENKAQALLSAAGI